MDLPTSATLIAICASIITIIWFVRDVRKENSKVLKSQEAILVTHTDILVTHTDILVKHTDILVKIEEGQREGFGIMTQVLKEIKDGQVTMSKILERIESNTRPT